MKNALAAPLMPPSVARAPWVARLLPATLLNRIFLLIASLMVVFISIVLAAFFSYHHRLQVEEAQQDSVMLMEVIHQAVQDSVVIGDYDTVRNTLGKAVQGSVFRSAQYLDMAGGELKVESRAPPSGDAPRWVAQVVTERLMDVNRPMSVGGVDYGVLRLHFDTEKVASSLWQAVLLGWGLWLSTLAVTLPLTRLALRHWLDGLTRLDAFRCSVAAGQDLPENQLDASSPAEIQQVVRLLRDTASLVRERELGRRALDNQKFALDQHAIVSITDLQGTITYANDRFCQITGFAQADLIGQNHRILQSGTHSPAVFTDLWATIASGRVWRGELCNRSRDGQLFWVSSTIVPLLDAGGTPEQYIAIRTDITNRVKAERQLAELNLELESKVQRRTQELQEASRAAAAANHAKGEFLSNMSHEMRTPLNSILGMTHLALRASPSPKVQQYLQTLGDSGQHLLELINNILDFSKIEAGKLELESVSLLLPQQMDAVTSLLDESARAKGLRLVVHIDPVLHRPLRGDPLRLRQILLNFASNAVKFSSKGTITLEAAVRRLDPDGPLLRLSVTDEGIGLDPEQARHLFQPFQQADSSTTRRFGGTGLGLAICRELATLMGGAVGLESHPGQGSTFWADVPLGWGTSASLTPSRHQPGHDSSANCPGTLPGLRLLVVDDNEVNQLVARELLESEGAVVEVAGSGADALATLFKRTFDCVLMDMQMPDMDGLETTRCIRAMAGLEKLPVIAMTANARPEDQLSCREAGMNDFITKPVVPETLFAVVARWTLERRPALPPAPPSRGAADADTTRPPVVDLRRLQLVTGKDSRRMASIAESFDRLSGKTLGDLQAARAARDLPALRAIAHKVRGSASMLGAEALVQSCAALEAATTGPADPPLPLQAMAERMVADMGQFQEALHGALDRAATGGAGGRSQQQG